LTGASKCATSPTLPCAGQARKPEQTPSTAMAIFARLWAFVSAKSNWWLRPILVVLLLFAGMTLLARGSAVTPFVYKLF
jgi:hypothetical protein